MQQIKLNQSQTYHATPHPDQINSIYGGSPLIVESGVARLATCTVLATHVACEAAATAQAIRGSSGLITIAPLGPAYGKVYWYVGAGELGSRTDNATRDGYPVESGLTVAEGDLIYISANGKWTNVAAGTAHPQNFAYGNWVSEDGTAATVQLRNLGRI